jgi:hypothetical protein
MGNGWKGWWVWKISAVALVSGLLVTAAVSAHDDHDKGKNQLTQILNKLDQIIAKLNSGGSGGGNYTLRWDQNLPSASRFKVLAAFNNQAVLDNNTGLVWELSPDTTARNFQDSTYWCANRTIGGLKGWRLPAIPELASLIDQSVLPSLPLPAGNPFINIQPVGYWSASTHAVTSSTAWVAFFGVGTPWSPPTPGDLGSDNKMSGSRLAWCVRGPMNAGQY